MTEIRAALTVPHDPAAAWAVLEDFDTHWRLADRFVEVLSLDGPAGARHGGVVRLHGPLGLRRTARTRVLELQAPRALIGEARVGERTSARVSWELSPHPRGTVASLTIVLQRSGVGDRALLALGGRWWLRRRLAATLERLALAADGAAAVPAAAIMHGAAASAGAAAG